MHFDILDIYDSISIPICMFGICIIPIISPFICIMSSPGDKAVSLRTGLTIQHTPCEQIFMIYTATLIEISRPYTISVQA